MKNEGKEIALQKLNVFIEDIENEKIESEENHYILKHASEKLVELQYYSKSIDTTISLDHVIGKYN